MNSTPTPEAQRRLDPEDPVLRQLTGAVELARAAAEEGAGDEVGEHVGAQVEDEAAVTHLFDAEKPGYRGWRWAVTVSCAGVDSEVTISEVVLLPGPDALVAPEWVPWQERVQAGDLGVGDLMPTAPDDPAIEDAAKDVGLGRARVMSRAARLDAAARWKGGEFGPRSDMARGAPGHCGTCGFYLPLAGSLRAAYGVCGNEIAPADGHLVHAEYGCGAHSEAEVEQVSPVLVADLIYDDNALLDLELVDRPPPSTATPEPEAPTQPPPDTALEPQSALPATPEPALESPGPAEPEARAAVGAPAEPDETVAQAEPSEPQPIVEPPPALEARPLAESLYPAESEAPAEAETPAEPDAPIEPESVVHTEPGSGPQPATEPEPPAEPEQQSFAEPQAIAEPPPAIESRAWAESLRPTETEAAAESEAPAEPGEVRPGSSSSPE